MGFLSLYFCSLTCFLRYLIQHAVLSNSTIFIVNQWITGFRGCALTFDKSRAESSSSSSSPTTLLQELKDKSYGTAYYSKHIQEVTQANKCKCRIMNRKGSWKVTYMLSPLIMYKPNTSCWTPSCEFQLRINKNTIRRVQIILYLGMKKKKRGKRIE